MKVNFAIIRFFAYWYTYTHKEVGDIYNIRTFSVNIKLIGIRYETGSLAFLTVAKASKNKLFIDCIFIGQLE